MQQQQQTGNPQQLQHNSAWPAVQTGHHDAPAITQTVPSLSRQDEHAQCEAKRLQWLAFDPRSSRPCTTSITHAYEAVDALTEIQQQLDATSELQQEVSWRIRMINDWCSMASRHVHACNLALQGHEVIDFLSEDQKNMSWVQVTHPPSNLPCQRVQGDPTSIAMSKCLHDPGRNSYYKLFKTVKKTIYGEIKLGIVCQPGPDGVQQHTSEHVAVKVFRRNETVQQTNKNGEQLLENGIREIVAQRYVSMPGHPHVQPMVSCLVDPEKIYVVQERAMGSLLDDMMNNQVVQTLPDGTLSDTPASCYSIEYCRLYFHQIVLGLQYLHNCGIAHRDVSLENTLKYPNEVIKIIDLGLCTPLLLAEPDGSGSVWAPVRYEGPVGKLRYMAPEVFQATQPILQTGFYDVIASDVWSLGCCFYTLLFNRQPYAYPNRGLCNLFDNLISSGVATQKCFEAVKLATASTTDRDVLLCEKALCLLSKILIEDPNSRPTLEDILDDEFFKC